MPECKRCTKRTLNTTYDNNHGYCESCLILVGRELITSTPDFDCTSQDTEWRINTKANLISLYEQLRDAGMINPLNGMGGSMRVLFWTLVNNEEYKRLRENDNNG